MISSWKMWVDNKTSMGQTRMNTLVDTLLLRRTKTQTSNVTGKAIVELPEKKVVNHAVTLTPVEQKVYNHVFSFSQQAMIQYMKVTRNHLCFSIELIDTHSLRRLTTTSRQYALPSKIVDSTSVS